jgi:hypothetical protein
VIIHTPPAGGFTGTIPGDATHVGTDDYLADHSHPPFLIWTWMYAAAYLIPSAKTEWGNHTWNRIRYSFQYIDGVRAVCNIQPPNTSTGNLWFEYSNDNGVTWFSLDGLGGPKINLSRYGTVDSGWSPIGAALKALGAADVLIRPVVSGGNKSITLGWCGLYGR